VALLKLPKNENAAYSLIPSQEVGGDYPQVGLVLLDPAFDARLYSVVDSRYYVDLLSSTT